MFLHPAFLFCLLFYFILPVLHLIVFAEIIIKIMDFDYVSIFVSSAYGVYLIVIHPGSAGLEAPAPALYKLYLSTAYAYHPLYPLNIFPFQLILPDISLPDKPPWHRLTPLSPPA